MTDSSESDSMNVVHLFKKKINSFFIVLGDNVVFLLYKSGRLSQKTFLVRILCIAPALAAEQTSYLLW